MIGILKHNCRQSKKNYSIEVYVDANEQVFYIKNINGGGCLAVWDVKFCPFCGKALKISDMVIKN